MAAEWSLSEEKLKPSSHFSVQFLSTKLQLLPHESPAAQAYSPPSHMILYLEIQASCIALPTVIKVTSSVPTETHELLQDNPFAWLLQLKKLAVFCVAQVT